MREWSGHQVARWVAYPLSSFQKRARCLRRETYGSLLNLLVMLALLMPLPQPSTTPATWNSTRETVTVLHTVPRDWASRQASTCLTLGATDTAPNFGEHVLHVELTKERQQR